MVDGGEEGNEHGMVALDLLECVLPISPPRCRNNPSSPLSSIATIATTII